MLAFILVRLARPMPSDRADGRGAPVGGDDHAGPAATSSRTCSAREMRLALGDAAHLGRHDAEARVLELRHRREAGGRRREARLGVAAPAAGMKSHAVFSRRRRHAGRVGRAEAAAARRRSGGARSCPGSCPARERTDCRRAAEARRPACVAPSGAAGGGSRAQCGPRARPPRLPSARTTEFRFQGCHLRAAVAVGGPTPRLSRESSPVARAALRASQLSLTSLACARCALRLRLASRPCVESRAAFSSSSRS